MISSEVRRAGTAVQHYCSNSWPECEKEHIYPGDEYLREVWLWWRTEEDGSITSRIAIHKHHYHPGCFPDPSLFDETEKSDECKHSYKEVA